MNGAFLSSEISLTGNAPSTYIAARSKFYFLPCYNSCVMKHSKNQNAAKESVRWYMGRAQYDKYFPEAVGAACVSRHRTAPNRITFAQA